MRIVLIGYWILLFFGTHVAMPGALTPPTDHTTVFDKFAHAAVFAVLAVLIAVSVTPRYGVLSPLRAVAIWLVVVGYGFVDEITQPYFSRTCDPLDWLADCFGALVGLVAYRRWTRSRPWSSSNELPETDQ